MGTTAEKGAYIIETKSLLKDKINNLGGSIDDNTTFRNYANQLQNVYDTLPKTSFQEGTDVTIENGLKGKIDFDDGKVGFGQASQESTQGYQLLNITATSGTKKGATWVVNEDKSITISTSGATTGPVTIPIVASKTLSAGTYYASGVTGGNENTYYFGILSTNWVFRNYNGITQFSVSEESTYSQIWIVIASGTTISTPITVYPMISTTNTSNYEQYTGGQASPNPSYPQTINSVTGNQDVVVSGKNLANIENVVEGYVSGANGSIVSSSTNNEGTIAFIKVKPSTAYTFKIFETSWESFGTSNWFAFAQFTTNNTSGFISRTTSSSLSQDYFTITTSSTTQYVSISARGLLSATRVQLEENNQATTYEPYITPTTYQLSLGDIELCGIGTYRDYIYKSGDKWYVHKEIGNNRLTSTNQEWNMIDTSISNKKRYSTSSFSNLIKRPSSTSVVGDILCSHYISQEATTTGSFGGHQGISTSPDGQVFVNDDNYLNDFAGWKTWLDSVFCEFYYALATPTETEITDTSLINQLNAWYNAHSNNGTTIITSNGNLPMIIKVRALKGE